MGCPPHCPGRRSDNRLHCLAPKRRCILRESVPGSGLKSELNSYNNPTQPNQTMKGHMNRCSRILKVCALASGVFAATLVAYGQWICNYFIDNLLPGLSWVKVDLAAEQQDAHAGVREASEAASIGLERLDL